MKIAYIIDLDGTLYDNSHRQHLIPADRNNTAGWVPFNAACAKDILRKEVANLVRAVAAEGGDVIFLTARGEDAREPTFNRLHQDFSFAYSSDLIMRQMNDHRSAAEFKSSFISGLKSEFSVYRDHTLVAIEDDPAVVDAMRALGVTVLHIDSKCCTVEKPHHNGMMQLSNELADLKRRHAELEEVIQQRNGECSWRQRESYDLAVIVKSLIFNLRKTGAGESAIFTAEDFLKRHGLQDAVLSFSSRPSGELSGNTEQLDTAPAQFESLAGEPVSEPYKLPVIGWARADYQDENRKGDAPLFIFGKKDPSAAWGVPYLRVGNYPEIPEGWKLVPTTATPSMARAGAAAARKYKEENGGYRAFVIYEAMVSQAPEVK